MSTLTTFTLVANQIDLSSDVKKLVKTFLNAKELLPKELPDVFKKIQITNRGNLFCFEIEYVPGNPVYKETNRLDELNLKNVKASYAALDGSIKQHFETYERTVELFENKDTGGTKAILTYKILPKAGSPDYQKYIDFDAEILARVDKIDI